MIQEIASVDGIAGYDASLIVHEDYFNEKGEALRTERYGFLYLWLLQFRV